MTDICSKYFWKTEPTAYHDFDTVTAINVDGGGDTRPNTLDPDSESEDEIDTDRPLTEQQFNSSTYWFTFRQMEHQAKACAICLLDFSENNRISVLSCHHNYHHECVKRWLTTRNANCPTCLGSSRANELTNAQLAPTNPRVVSPSPPILSQSTVRPTRTGLRLRTAHESEEGSTRTSSSSSNSLQDDNSRSRYIAN